MQTWQIKTIANIKAIHEHQLLPTSSTNLSSPIPQWSADEHPLGRERNVGVEGENAYQEPIQNPILGRYNPHL